MLPSDVEIIGIVVNEKGAERAIAPAPCRRWAFLIPSRPSFFSAISIKRRRSRSTLWRPSNELAYKAGLDVAAYISMAFGNPYGDAWSMDEMADACELLADIGVRYISLADTVGLATPEHIARDRGRACSPADNAVEIGVHLHARPAEAAAKIRAAYEAGLQALRRGHRRTGRMSLCAGCAGREYSHRDFD